MNSMPADASIDQNPVEAHDTPVWRRMSTLIVFLLLAVFMVGGAAMSDVSANVADMINILAVVTFVGAMFALALNMVGDAYRS